MRSVGGRAQDAAHFTAGHGLAFERSPVPAAVLVLEGGGVRTGAVNAALRELVATATGRPLAGHELVGLLEPGLATDPLATLRGHRWPARLGRRRVEVRAAPMHDDEAEWILQLVDVSASDEREQALAEAVSRLEDIIANSAALIYVKDTEGRYTLVNDYFVNRFGFDADAVIGSTDDDLFSPEAAASYRRHDEHVLRTGEAIEVEEPATDVPDGSWLSIKFAITDHSGRRYAVGGISTDITDRKHAEAAVREARDEAERANAAKSEFLSRMSHELRTPLNAILGFGQLLSFEALEPSARQSVDRIVRGGNHLLALINEVLDITRIEAGGQPIEVEPVHVCEPLLEALELVRPLAVERDVELVIDLHGGLHRYVRADMQRLKQVLLNLLTNAVKYNRDGGVVRAFMREPAHGLMRVLVVDTGPGLTRAEQARVFLPFERLGADSGQIEGSGLGLALSKTLAEAMGGRIGIEHSAPGEGSAFFVELELTEPVSQEPAGGAPGALSAREWDLGQARILYIEDNLSNLALVESIFARVGQVELIPAMQGQIGLELAARHGPDLVLLDLHLPDADGIDVLRRLKSGVRTSAIPVLVLSADATPARIERLRAEGTFGYLTKPLQIEQFLDSVAAALGRTR